MLKKLINKIFRKKEDPRKQAESLIEFIENNGPEDFKLLGWQKQLFIYWFVNERCRNKKLKIKRQKKLKRITQNGLSCNFMAIDEWSQTDPEPSTIDILHSNMSSDKTMNEVIDGSGEEVNEEMESYYNAFQNGIW